MAILSQDDRDAVIHETEVAAYPDAGAVLIVSTHLPGGAIAPVVVGWVVVRVLQSGEHQSIGGVFARRSAARAFARSMFPNIVGWQKLGSTVCAATVRQAAVLPLLEDVPSRPRRRANGLRIPLWRSHLQ